MFQHQIKSLNSSKLQSQWNVHRITILRVAQINTDFVITLEFTNEIRKNSSMGKKSESFLSVWLK